MNITSRENNQYKYIFKNQKITNYINTKQSKYKDIFEHSLKCSNDKKVPKGIIELKFLYFINGERSAFYKKNKPFILPSSRVIANIIGCSNAYVLKLLKKYSYLLKHISKQKVWNWRYKKDSYTVDPNFTLDYKKLNIYLFKTKWYKTKVMNDWSNSIKIYW